MSARHAATTLQSLCGAPLGLSAAADLAAALEGVTRILAARASEQRRVLLDRYYPALVEAVCEHALVFAAAVWAPAQQAAALDPLLTEAPPRDAFLALCAALRGVGDHKAAAATAAWLDRALLRNSDALAVLLAGDEVVDLVASLPDRVLPALARSSPVGVQFQPRALFTRLFSAALDDPRVPAAALGRLWTRLAKVGYATGCTPAVAGRLGEPRVQAVLGAVAPGALEPVLFSLLHEIPEASPGLAMIADLGGDIVARRFVCDRQMAPRALARLIEALTLRRGLLSAALSHAATQWRDAHFANHAPSHRHHSLCRVLWKLLAVKDAAAIVAETDALSALMYGVQVRLSSSLEATRLLGIVLGERISQVVDPSNAMVILDSDAERQRVLESFLGHIQGDAPEPEPEPEPAPLAEHVPPKKSAGPEDPDAAVTDQGWGAATGGDGGGWDSESDAGSLSGSSASSGDDGLSPYALDDDETDLDPTRPPAFLRDTLHAIQHGDADHVDQLEGALRGCAELVRAHPGDAPMFGEALARALLRLEDEFNLPNFEQMRRSALQALLVCSPEPASKYLVSQFYDHNLSLSQRVDILTALQLGAQELASAPSSEAAPDPAPATTPRAKPSESEAIIQARLEKKTRRWGKVRAPVRGHENRFHAVAAQFFFGLMVRFDDPANCFNLLGEDNMLLGTLVRTLGVMVQCAANAPDAPQMAITLVRFGWALRTVPHIYVRRSLLYALSEALGAVPRSLLLPAIPDELEDLAAWLVGLLDDSDPTADPTARQLALLCAKLLREHQESAAIKMSI